MQCVLGVVLLEVYFCAFVLLVLFSFICLVLSGEFFGLFFFLHHCHEVCPTSGPLDRLVLVVVQHLLTSFFLRTRGDAMLNKSSQSGQVVATASHFWPSLQGCTLAESMDWYMCSADLCWVLCVLRINVLLIHCHDGSLEDIQNCMFIKLYYYNLQRVSKCCCIVLL